LSVHFGISHRGYFPGLFPGSPLLLRFFVFEVNNYGGKIDDNRSINGKKESVQIGNDCCHISDLQVDSLLLDLCI
jgi:hypothetical protein